jgi:magnesium transporter
MGTMRLVLDTRHQSRPCEVPVERLPELLADRESRLWLDISDPDEEDVALLSRTFGFHELALEDVTRPHERPRCDCYSGYHFIVVYAAEQADGAILPRELNLFWGGSYLVTIHRRTGAVLSALAEARRRWERQERRGEDGIAPLAYALFESLVDGYFVVQDRVRERLDEIQGAIFSGAEGAAEDLFRLRKELLRVPRLLAPTTHVLSEVLRRDGTVPEHLRPYFADVQDHATHVLAEFDTYRDLLAAALDVHVFSAFNRLGLIMRRLTAITVIIMVPNFVASIYGMNFAHLMPASESPWGFFAVAAFLMVMVVWGFIHSKILGWL